MLEKKITTFKAGGKDIPMICTFNVLEYIQENYGTIFAFQKQILGMIDSGKIDEDGKPEIRYGTVNIKAVLDGAAAMINEGLAVSGKEERVNHEETGILLTAAEITVSEAAGMVLEELIKCIEPKKERAVRNQEEKRTSKLISRGFFMSVKQFFTIRKKR